MLATSCLIPGMALLELPNAVVGFQDKGMMDPESRKRKLKQVIYGCDICQISCPYNKGLDNPTEIDQIFAHPELIPFIELSSNLRKNSDMLLEVGEARTSSSANVPSLR